MFSYCAALMVETGARVVVVGTADVQGTAKKDRCRLLIAVKVVAPAELEEHQDQVDKVEPRETAEPAET